MYNAMDGSENYAIEVRGVENYSIDDEEPDAAKLIDENIRATGDCDEDRTDTESEDMSD